MKLDTSVAPELAVLTAPLRLTPEPAGSGQAVPATVGYLAACLRILVADPRSWWDSVRFDPWHPVHVAVGAPSPRCEVWLLVLPPGYRSAGSQPHGSQEHGSEEQAWQVGCLVAGEMAEQVAGPDGWRTRPLSPGRTRVRGGPGPCRMINTGAGYAVSLHARPVPARTPAT
ncbi:MAG TPA: cysteine dioxygenase [Streptosporangiaceae bacterium]|jgi:hypothetical protein|nr:cysteine dioxygenase [Streptosporangiaceae bacterium]